MKPKHILITILAVLFVFPLMGTFAQQAVPSGSIEVITTFDYPGAGNYTLPQKINERGDVVGEFIDSSGVTRGFIRFSNGSFSAPIVDPNDTVGFTEGRGINNSRIANGDYVASDGFVHSFFLSNGTFTEYDVPGAVQTNLLSINDAGDFTGAFDPDGSGIFQAFVGVAGTLTSYSVPGAAGTLAYEINNSKQLIGRILILTAQESFTASTGTPVGRCTSRSILRAPLRQSCLDLTIGTGWWADMRTAQARLMDSSLFRQINLPLSIIPARPLHRLTESMTKGLSLVVMSMLPALLMDSWLASEAHRRQLRPERK